MNPFKIYYPIKPITINQPFGNKDQVYTDMGLLGHNGIDFGAIHGKPIYAAHDGTAYYEIDANSGHGVVLITDRMFDYVNPYTSQQQAYFKTIYWHMCDSVKEPQYKSPVEGHEGLKVKAGDLLGYADSTGISSGDHLHFGLKPMLPGEPPTTWDNVAQNNGYLGSVDPTPYFNGLFAQDIKGFYSFTTDFGYFSLRFQDVYNLQKVLVAQGFANFTPTGFFGTLTLQAVKAYQVKHGIEETGYVGPITRAALNNS